MELLSATYFKAVLTVILKALRGHGSSPEEDTKNMKEHKVPQLASLKSHADACKWRIALVY